MPPIVNIRKCTGCNGAPESRCENVCPGDLMVRSEDGKAYCRKSRDCWDCMCCAKVCPVGAISIRAPYELGYRGASLTPKILGNEIEWTCVDIYGKKEVYRMERIHKNKGEERGTEEW